MSRGTSATNWQPGIDACSTLLREAFPDLEIATISLLGEGWDSVAFLVNGEFVFRLPKRESVVSMLRRERQVLDAIACRLPTAIPRYELVNDHLSGFPSSVGGYRLVAGTPLSNRAMFDVPLAALAAQICCVLTALHETELNTIPGLNHEDTDAWWSDRWRMYQETIPVIEQTSQTRTAVEVRTRWEEAFSQARAIGFTPVLVHGDLAPDHILLNERGELAGLIDFGDAGPGDPAIDLAGLPDLLTACVLDCATPDCHERNRLRQRRAFYRLTVPFHAIHAGLAFERPDLIDEGLVGIHERFGV